MNWDAVGAVGEILGALAVFVTLAYLAVQIRQNTIATKSAAVQGMTTAAQNTALAAASSKESASVWLRGKADVESLDDAERQQYRLLLVSQIIATDTLYWSYRQGNLDRELWERQSNWMRGYLQLSGGVETWQDMRQAGSITPSFVEYVEEHFPDELKTRE